MTHDLQFDRGDHLQARPDMVQFRTIASVVDWTSKTGWLGQLKRVNHELHRHNPCHLIIDR